MVRETSCRSVCNRDSTALHAYIIRLINRIGKLQMTCRIRTGDWKDKTMNLEGKRVLVVGSGKSGLQPQNCSEKRNHICTFDGNKDLDVTALIEKNPVFAGAEILWEKLAWKIWRALILLC